MQAFIYKVDLAYQPDGRLAVDANADRGLRHSRQGHARVADGRIQPAQFNKSVVRGRSPVQSDVSAGVPDRRAALLPRVPEDARRPLPDHAGRHPVLRRHHSTMVLVSITRRFISFHFIYCT